MELRKCKWLKAKEYVEVVSKVNVSRYLCKFKNVYVYGYFHKWTTVEGEDFALVENLNGKCRYLDMKNIIFDEWENPLPYEITEEIVTDIDLIAKLDFGI